MLKIDEKTKYFKMALALQRINIDERTAEQAILTYERMVDLEHQFSLRDAAEIEAEIEDKYGPYGAQGQPTE